MAINRRVVYDALHKSSVTFLIGFSVLGTVWLAFRTVNYFAGQFFLKDYILALKSQLLKCMNV